MKYLDRPIVEYVDHMGDDLDVSNSAKVSYLKFDEDFTPKNEKLINFLATNDHYTPFTHQVIKLRESVPIFVARQRFKHTVGFSYNEVSRRYITEEPAFYSPDIWRVKAETNKQGSVVGELKDGYTQELMDEYVALSYSTSMLSYERMLEAGVCPEQARMVLPTGMYTTYIVTGSLAAYARAYNLRIAKDSQKEIQDLANRWDEIIRPLFPVAWKALVGEENG